jgi:hypothetical protein
MFRNQKVGGSIPPVSTKESSKKATPKSGLFAAWLRSGRQDFSPPVMPIPDTGSPRWQEATTASCHVAQDPWLLHATRKTLARRAGKRSE